MFCLGNIFFVCVCVCVCERERERSRATKFDWTDRQWLLVFCLGNIYFVCVCEREREVVLQNLAG